MPFREKVKENIKNRQDEYIALLKKIVRQPSTTGNELEAQTIVAERLKSKGLEVDVWTPDYNELIKSNFFKFLSNNYNRSRPR
ncbi:hypothetical protein ACDX78_15280 [Virgibacillus oceani]